MTRFSTADAKRAKEARVENLIRSKVASVPYPLQQMKIVYSNQTKGKSYSDDEDRFLLVELAKYGVGKEDTYEKIKRDINEWPAFRFDWFLKSVSLPFSLLLVFISISTDASSPSSSALPSKSVVVVKLWSVSSKGNSPLKEETRKEPRRNVVDANPLEKLALRDRLLLPPRKENARLPLLQVMERATSLELVLPLPVQPPRKSRSK